MCTPEGREENLSIYSIISSSPRNDAVGAPQPPQIHPRALGFIEEQRQLQEELNLSCAQN